MARPPLSSSNPPVIRAKGVTSAERYLHRLCDRSFLRLWSYAGVYRNQGNGRGGHGKEICDLLVVFGDHVIIFSDKDIAFPNSGNLERDWQRWHSRAVVDGAKQVWGAERWLRQFPNRVFLDRECEHPFPFALPAASSMVVHRIVAAHGASGHCRAQMGGSGTLLVMPQVPPGAIPFAVGDIDASRGFVHVLDDAALHILITECDTITDFVSYLTKKEAFIRNGSFMGGAGEDDLIAYYFRHLTPDGGHDFEVPAEGMVMLNEGFYEDFLSSPERASRVAADQISYAWDRLIEEFAGNVMGGTLFQPASDTVEYHERGLRILAAESRLRRRMLASALLGIMDKAKGSKLDRHMRVVEPSQKNEPYYVFLVLRRPTSISYDQYRVGRRQFLLDHCRVLRHMRPGARTIVGIGVDPPGAGEGSEDLVAYDATRFDDAEREDAVRAQKELGIMTNFQRSATTVHEFPSTHMGKETVRKMPKRGGRFPGTGRNEQCPCESGLKYKRCCGP